jgi:hypothetical protein
MDLTNGSQRHWYAGEDGVRRWADNDEPLDIPRPVDPMEEEE